MTTPRRAAPRPPELLAVSFAFPPLALPRSIQVARLLKNLRASTVLVCSDGEKGIRLDPTLEPGAEASLRACLRVPFRSAGWRSLADRISYRLDLPLWNKSPDRYTAWQSHVLRAIDAYAGRERYRPDAVVTFGYPMSDHLTGLRLKRRYGVPWLAHFSDPWVGNPYSKNEGDRLSRARNAALERRVIAGADRVIFTSQETVEMVMAKYPPAWAGKARVLPQCYDPVLYPPRVTPAAGEPLVLRHTGWFYGPRTPAPLAAALRVLLATDAAALEGVRVELVGDIDEQTLAASGVGNLPEGLVAVKPPVGYGESLALIAAADGLLVIDAPAERSVFLPSKLIDYVGAGRPVLGLTPAGAARSLIGELGGWVAGPADVPAMVAALKDLLRHLRSDRASAQPWGAPAVRSRYAAPVVARSFEEMLAEVLG
jgi:glycosyltransferase involved in cell wall biosynthesis